MSFYTQDPAVIAAFKDYFKPKENNHDLHSISSTENVESTTGRCQSGTGIQTQSSVSDNQG